MDRQLGLLGSMYGLCQTVQGSGLGSCGGSSKVCSPFLLNTHTTIRGRTLLESHKRDDDFDNLPRIRYIEANEQSGC